MLANANSLESVPASRSVREFVAVCARHNVPYGNLNCLPTLLRELNSNKHFAMHFWSVVAKQSSSTEPVITAIVQAVTGRTPAEVREAGPAHRIVLSRLETLLAGQDVEPEETIQQRSTVASPPDRVTTSAESVGATHPPHVGEDVLPIRRVTYTKGRRPRRHVADAEPVIPASDAVRDENMRLVLMPDSPAHDSAKTRSSEPLPTRSARLQLNTAPPIPVPLSSYAEEEPRRRTAAGLLVGAVAIAVVAAGGYLFVRSGGNEAFSRLGTSVRAGYDSAVATWKGEPAQAPTAAAIPPTARTSPNAPSISAAEASKSPGPAPNQPAPAVQQLPQKERAASAGLTPAQSMAATAAYNQQRDAAISAETMPASGGVVQVPESVMNAHLIASRVPVLPDEARDAGVSGIVRMQATINRSGYVSRLHVLQGPTDLRHAALTAVSAWRYRPYLVSGQPVDVMTTVTVDFSSLE